jgi:hypothetical protein
LDVFVHPQVKAQFGDIHDAIESQVNLAPVVSTNPFKGMSLSAQWIFPIQNELGYEGDQGRPGLLTLNQTVRLPDNAFISGTIGYFTEHRYGVDLEAKRFWRNGRWAAGANVGITGFAAYSDRAWYFSDIGDWTYNFGVETHLTKLDVMIKASYAKFVYQDKGVRFDLMRQFGEVDIGFFAIKTEGGRNGGFFFSVPICPSKRMSPKRVRISPALRFPWSYSYRGMPSYGIQYTTRNSIDEFMKNLNPNYVKNQFLN